MNLKEAYRYANFLNELLERSYALLEDTNVVTSVEQRHLRSRADRKVGTRNTMGRGYRFNVNNEQERGLFQAVAMLPNAEHKGGKKWRRIR